MDELKIAKDVDEVFDLEELILEGKDARETIEIEFPDGRKAKALIRPITTSEFRKVYSSNASELLVNVLELSLMNMNGEPLDKRLIEAMPVGLPVKIVEQIFKISGIGTNPEDADKLIEELELFP